MRRAICLSSFQIAFEKRLLMRVICRDKNSWTCSFEIFPNATAFEVFEVFEVFSNIVMYSGEYCTVSESSETNGR
jgi:hypothetical protein